MVTFVSFKYYRYIKKHCELQLHTYIILFQDTNFISQLNYIKIILMALRNYLVI